MRETMHSAAAKGLIIKPDGLVKVLLPAALMSLAACSAGSTYVPKTPTVQTQERSQEVAFATGSQLYTPANWPETQRFFEDVPPLATHHVHIYARSGDQRDLQRAGELREWLMKRGFPGHVIDITQTDRPAGELLVRVEYAVALPPAGCPDWSDGGGTDFSNATQANYGCADATNLARQVADPADLVRGQGGPFGDGDRSQVAITKYKTDQVTQTVKDSASSSGVSQ
jgi:pilus biogenesis lipoprotein CpaD